MTSAKKLVVGSAAIVATLVVAMLGAYYGVQKTTAFEIAHDSVIALAGTRALGEPVTAKLRPFGYAMRVSDSSGTADFAFDVSGQQGKGIAHVRLKKELGQWSVVDSRLIRAGS